MRRVMAGFPVCIHSQTIPVRCRTRLHGNEPALAVPSFHVAAGGITAFIHPGSHARRTLPSRGVGMVFQCRARPGPGCFIPPPKAADAR
jgi:hypothetical protein